jgi:hypothetical protein
MDMDNDYLFDTLEQDQVLETAVRDIETRSSLELPLYLTNDTIAHRALINTLFPHYPEICDLYKLYLVA